LTAYTGPSTVTLAGTIIDGKSIGCLTVRASGVVIKNSKITCGSGYSLYVDDASFNPAWTPLTVQDSEIDGQVSASSCFGEGWANFRRVNVHGCENGFDTNQKLDVRDSYVHDLKGGSTAHADGLQMACGHWTGTGNGCASGYAPGALDVTLIHNTIYGVHSDGSLGTSAIISNKGTNIDTNILIQNNLLAGGAVSLYCQQGSKGNNYRVLDNHFSTRFSSKGGAFGFSTDCSDETQSGNVVHETGSPLSLP